CQHYYSTPSSV
nr:immunoglobulin light chain junction region [Macaca mulatta]